MQRWLQRILIAGGLILALVLFGVVPIILNPLRDTIKQLSSEALGVEIVIEGRLLVHLGLTPRVSGTYIQLRQPTADGGQILSVRELQITPKVFDLFAGKLHFINIEVSGVELDYCAPLPKTESPQGDGDAIPSLAFDSITLDALRADCDGAGTAIELESLRANLPEVGDGKLSASGKVADLPVELLLAAPNLNEVLSDMSAIPVDLRATAATTAVEISATLLDVETAPRIDANLSISSDDDKWLGALAGPDMPDMGRLDGSLQAVASADAIEVNDLSVELGNIPGLEQPLTIGDGTITYEFELNQAKLRDARVLAVGNTAHINATLNMEADCPALDAVATIDKLQLPPILDLARRADVDVPDFVADLQRLEVDVQSCGKEFGEHLHTFIVNVGLSNLRNLALDDERIPASIETLSIRSGWNAASNLELSGTLFDEPLTALASAGSAKQLLSGIAAPVNVKLNGAGTNVSLRGRSVVFNSGHIFLYKVLLGLGF